MKSRRGDPAAAAPEYMAAPQGPPAAMAPRDGAATSANRFRCRSGAGAAALGGTGRGGAGRVRRRRGGSGPEEAPSRRALSAGGQEKVSPRAAHPPSRPGAAALGVGTARGPHLLHGFRLQAWAGVLRAALILPLPLAVPAHLADVCPAQRGQQLPGWAVRQRRGWESSLFFGVVRLQHRDQSQSHWHGRNVNEDAHVAHNKENQLSK